MKHAHLHPGFRRPRRGPSAGTVPSCGKAPAACPPRTAAAPGAAGAAGNQQGIALVVSLVLLLLVTLLGVSSLRSVLLEEKMAANQFDRSLAFQAAEAALRQAEARVLADQPVAGGQCNAGVCPPPDPAAALDRWNDPAFSGWEAATVTLDTLAGAAPEYLIEYLGATFPCDPANPSTSSSDCKRYRITARSRPDGDQRASVMLQSVYATP